MTITEKIKVTISRSSSSILFWTHDINNDKHILPGKDILYFIFYIITRISLIVLLWIFVDQDNKELLDIKNLTGKIESKHDAFITGTYIYYSLV
jgi:hypothetical protein